MKRKGVKQKEQGQKAKAGEEKERIKSIRK